MPCSYPRRALRRLAESGCWTPAAGEALQSGRHHHPLLTMTAAWILWTALGCAGKEEPPGEIILTETVLDFEQVPVGTWKTRQLGLENVGEGDVDLLSSSVFEGDPDVWMVEREGGGTLAPGEYVVFTVTFTPRTRGEERARLQLRTDIPDTPTLYVDLVAEGTASLDDEDGDGYTPADGDCADDDPSRHPGAEERCNGIDDDCSGSIPEEEEDRDYDGLRYCEGDCDDDDVAVYPGAPEICDDKDNDCDGSIPDRVDGDGDTFTPCSGDCDDDDPSRWPWNEELCDGKDNDCDREIDEVDEDRDDVTLCEGDCDDLDPSAWPVFVSLDGGPVDIDGDGKLDDPDGTSTYPFDNLEDAAAHIDTICQTVIFQPGTYTIRYLHLAGHLRLLGGGDTADEVWLRAGSGAGDRLFEVSPGASLALANLTLYGADITGNGGVIKMSGADLLTEDVLFIDNTVTGAGAAVYAAGGGTVTLRRTEVQSNTAGTSGGALYLSGTDLTLEDVLFLDNSATTGDGGAVYAGAGAAVSAQQVRLWSNAAGGSGGALALADVAEGARLQNLWVQGNTAGSQGGGVSITGTADELLLANSTFLDNSATAGSGLYSAAVGPRIWASLFGWSDGTSPGLVLSTSGSASAAYNVGYSPAGLAELSIPADQDGGSNQTAAPLLTRYTGSESPSATNLTPATGSPLIDAGPDGADWLDTDGTRNDVGYTGGPSAP